jgi:hypothetical protein
MRSLGVISQKLSSINSSSVNDSEDLSLAKSLYFHIIFLLPLLGVNIDDEVKLSL